MSCKFNAIGMIQNGWREILPTQEGSINLQMLKKYSSLTNVGHTFVFGLPRQCTDDEKFCCQVRNFLRTLSSLGLSMGLERYASIPFSMHLSRSLIMT